VIESGFVVVSGSDRFVLEANVFESGNEKRFPQTGESIFVIGFRFGADEAHGATYDDLRRSWTELVFSTNTDVGENTCNEFFQSNAATEHFGGLQAAAGEEGFERLDEATLFVGAEIFVDS
jgi:hypothetical protein